LTFHRYIYIRELRANNFVSGSTRPSAHAFRNGLYMYEWLPSAMACSANKLKHNTLPFQGSSDIFRN